MAATAASGACCARATDRLAPVNANNKPKPCVVVLEIIIPPARRPDNAFIPIQNYDVADFAGERIDNEGIIMRKNCATSKAD
jgi:hypothetical protein